MVPTFALTSQPHPLQVGWRLRHPEGKLPAAQASGRTAPGHHPPQLPAFNTHHPGQPRSSRGWGLTLLDTGTEAWTCPGPSGLCCGDENSISASVLGCPGVACAQGRGHSGL